MIETQITEVSNPQLTYGLCSHSMVSYIKFSDVWMRQEEALLARGRELAKLKLEAEARAKKKAGGMQMARLHWVGESNRSSKHLA